MEGKGNDGNNKRNEVIRTVALDLTLINIALLGSLVVVRKFLGWSIVVEIEGHWPWQKPREFESGAGDKAAKENAA
jgi:hypothetical protein